MILEARKSIYIGFIFLSVLLGAVTLISGANAQMQDLGCYEDRGDRALSINISWGGMTPDSCVAAALSRGYRYAGIQYGGECWAGNTVGYGKLDDSQCSMTCNVDTTKLCGGSWAQRIYDTTPLNGPLFVYESVASTSDYPSCSCDSSQQSLDCPKDRFAATQNIARCVDVFTVSQGKRYAIYKRTEESDRQVQLLPGAERSPGLGYAGGGLFCINNMCVKEWGDTLARASQSEEGRLCINGVCVKDMSAPVIKSFKVESGGTTTGDPDSVIDSNSRTVILPGEQMSFRYDVEGARYVELVRKEDGEVAEFTLPGGKTIQNLLEYKNSGVLTLTPRHFKSAISVNEDFSFVLKAYDAATKTGTPITVEKKIRIRPEPQLLSATVARHETDQQWAWIDVNFTGPVSRVVARQSSNSTGKEYALDNTAQFIAENAANGCGNEGNCSRTIKELSGQHTYYVSVSNGFMSTEPKSLIVRYENVEEWPPQKISRSDWEKIPAAQRCDADYYELTQWENCSDTAQYRCFDVGEGCSYSDRDHSSGWCWPDVKGRWIDCHNNANPY